MWYHRDFLEYFTQGQEELLPIKVLKGPRQCGKTSLLAKLQKYQMIYFDDLSVRQFAQENPKLFFDQLSGPLVLDEASLSPEIFPELKRRLDQERRSSTNKKLDIWITGSNQTLLQRDVRESLAGRASYFDLNTLSLHELNSIDLSVYMMRGGWPELHIKPELNPVRYLNDLIATFIEKDIVSAAGIEKTAAFSKCLQLTAGRVGQLFNASDIARNVGVEVLTVQSWLRLLEENAIVFSLMPYASNLNQRLIKTPKYYFLDVALAARLQGWNDYGPLQVSPAFGHLLENMALGEIIRFFSNRGESAQIYFIRTKDQVEIDFLIQLPNQVYIAAEVKAKPQDFTQQQLKVLDSLGIRIKEKWILSPIEGPKFANAKTISFSEIWQSLNDNLV
ncbi:MAG: ATP-binding protein [Bacteriovoracia bacterium]